MKYHSNDTSGSHSTSAVTQTSKWAQEVPKWPMAFLKEVNS